MLFHAALKQFLLEPAKEQERLRKEVVSIKRFIESVVEIEEDKDVGDNE